MTAAVHILILAAGASTRMGGADKLVETIGDQPLLRRTACVALATGAPVTVTLAPGFPARQAALQGLKCRIARVPDATLGMSASLRRGIMAVRAHGAGAGLMVLPADMPLVTTEALAAMITQFALDPQVIMRGATLDGRQGHPAIFPADLWDALSAIRGDEGGRSVLQAHAWRVRLYPLPGDMAVLDLDTPEDWAAFRDGEG